MRVVSIHNGVVGAFALRAGDRKGFSLFYNQFYLAVFQFAKKFVTDPQVAEDITAEAFIRLWNYAEGNDVKDLRSLVITTTRNKCLDFLRSEKLHHEKEKEIKWLQEQDERTEFMNAEIKAEVLQYIQEEVSKLPDTTQKVFRMIFVEGMKTRDIVKVLGLSEQTIYNHKNTALRQLRMVFKDKPVLSGLLYLLMSN